MSDGVRRKQAYYATSILGFTVAAGFAVAAAVSGGYPLAIGMGVAAVFFAWTIHYGYNRMPSAKKRIHFVEHGSLAEELDRLDISRAASCRECGALVEDAEVACLYRVDDGYETVCKHCHPGDTNE